MIEVQGLTGIGTVKVPRPWLIRIRALGDLFPSEGFNVEHVNIRDHTTLCDEAAALREMR